MVNKTTDTIQSVETKLTNELAILKYPNVGGERKKSARITVKRYEKHLRDVSDKQINGKVYPKPLCFCDDKPMNKIEVLKLIDSVDAPEHNQFRLLQLQMEQEKLKGLDITGLFVSDDRTSEFARTSILDLYNKAKQ